ncbi:hypothetical protein V2J09_017799 [Rumex salicifolius]
MNLCGSGRVVGSMTLSSPNPTRKPGDAAAIQFPAGLRVLVVDDDPTCLKILERMLRTCQYEVTKCDRAELALNELRRNKNGFDIVLSDVHMPDMDGFKLLEHIGLEMDLPVIMMSADDSKNVVMKGVTHGACDYLIKPVRMEALKNIWQHVVRKKKNEWKDIDQSGSYDEGEKSQKQDDTEYTSPANDGSWKSSKRKGEDDDADDKDDSSTLKKPRVVWSVELHQQFVAAVNQLGIDIANTNFIQWLAICLTLTYTHWPAQIIALFCGHHKYRLYLRRLSGVSQHNGGLNGPFMGPQDPGFGSMPPLNGFDLQTLAAAGQLPGQTLAGYQPGLVRSAIKPGMSMPFMDQRNLFSFESPKQQLSNTNKQISLLHGIPTTMELKQLAGFQQPSQFMGSLNLQTSSQSNSLLMPMVQQHSRSGQLMSESISGQISQIQSQMGQSISSPGVSVGVLPRIGGADNSQVLSYGSVSQSSSVVDFSVSHAPDLACNSFPLASTPAITNSKGLVKEEVNSNGKRPRGFSPNYGMFNELSQRKPQDWHSSSMSYGSPQNTSSIANSIDVSPSILVNQGFISGQKPVQSVNSLATTNILFSTPTEVLQQQRGSIQNANNSLMDNVSLRIKTENVQEQIGNNLYAYQYGQDDLMSAILKQPESLGSVEGDNDFDEGIALYPQKSSEFECEAAEKSADLLGF